MIRIWKAAKFTGWLSTYSRKSSYRKYSEYARSLGPALPPLESSIKKARSMLDHIYNVQNKFPDAVVLTQVGSFMELYFDQAVTYGALLNLKVARKAHRSPVVDQDFVHMAGFPLSEKERYERILVKDHGKTVVTLMQDSKHVLKGGTEEEKRPISRILTPGTLLEEAFVDQNSNNFLASVVISRGACLLWVDVASGKAKYQVIEVEDLGNELARIAPKEVLFDRTSAHRQFITETVQQYLPSATLSPFKFPPPELVTTRSDHADRFHFEKLDPSIQRAYAGLVRYIETCMPGAAVELQEPEQFLGSDVMQLDSRARAALEISASSSGSRKGSLLSIIRRTRTLSGSRLFEEWIAAPLQDPAEIKKRQDKVQLLLDQSRTTIVELQNLLSEMPDGPRTLQKLWLNRINPLDLIAFARSMSVVQRIADVLSQIEALPVEWKEPLKTLVDAPLRTAEQILKAINVDVLKSPDSTSIRDLTIDAAPVDAVADTADIFNSSSGSSSDSEPKKSKKPRRKTPAASSSCTFGPATSRDYKPVLFPTVSPRLQNIYERRDGFSAREHEIISRLRESYGPSAELRWAPSHQFHVSIILNGKNEPERHVLLAKNKKSAYLLDREWSVLGNERVELNNELRIEEEYILNELRQTILTQHSSSVRKLYALVDEIDVQMSLASLAVERWLVRPEVVGDSNVFEIEKGRHITVETGLALGGLATNGFVANDCNLSSPQQVCMITGPNMGGKSTYIRQNAIIALLAHIGSFVPAERARIGIVDRIFCRIGAGDDLYSGRSTFMVEMLETAAILNNATPRSLAVVDEVGRGTSGKDGLAIAFASIRHLALRTQCRTLFATHYGQEIWNALKTADSTTNSVTEKVRLLQASVGIANDGEPVFNYKLQPGISASSCGLLIAEMAGFPQVALEDASSLFPK